MLVRYILILVSLVSCAGTTKHVPDTKPAVVAGQLELERIAEGVWLHTSYNHVPGFGLFPSNGLVVEGRDGVVLVDTAWGQEPTSELLEWASDNIGEVHAVVVTHWHDDRMGGLAEVHRRGIPSYGTMRTIAESKTRGVVGPQNQVSGAESLGKLGLNAELYYPGPGHSQDNVVLWLSNERLLFGGCLVKSMSAKTLGNTADANIVEWLKSIRQVQGRYESAQVVVPGHGARGGSALLDHTASLLRAEQATKR